MKKLALSFGLVVVILFPTIIIAQVGESSGGSGNSCKNALLQSFAACLASHGVNYYVTNVGTNTICVNAVGSTPPGHIQSCIAHYDNSRGNCTEAPAIVYQTGVSGGSSKRVIMNQH